MTAKILDGKALAETMRSELIAQVERLGQHGCRPHLVAVQVGEAPASKVYTQRQADQCRQVGLEYELLNLPVQTSQARLRAVIDELNAREEVTGIILQMPLPVHLNLRDMQTAIAPEKDVEGIHPLNYGRLFGTTGHVAPCTALAAVELLRSTGLELSGQEAVVVGHSEIVGKPIAILLLQSRHGAPTVTVCHESTRDLAAHTRRADILFVATGVRQSRWQRYAAHATTREHPPLPDLGPLVRADMVKPGAVVIDVAINRIPAGFDESGRPLRDEKGQVRMTTVGDVDFEGARQVTGFLSPVPGGVGPVTVMMLMRNTISCARRLCHGHAEG